MLLVYILLPVWAIALFEASTMAAQKDLVLFLVVINLGSKRFCDWIILSRKAKIHDGLC